MSQERAQFELAYNEAFFSGLGVAFDPTEPEYREFVQTFVEDHLTRPDMDTGFYSRKELGLSYHPYREAWVEQDIEELARIAYFGRKLINCARVSLESNPGWEACAKAIEGDLDNKVAQFLQFSEWVNAHPDQVDPGRSNDPDVASPLRLATWPKGDYINCLGQSIALAAAAELDGQRYVYANELRTGDDLVYELHKTIRTEIERLYPEFFAQGGAMQEIYGFVDRILSMTGNSQESYNNLFFDSENTLSVRNRDGNLREWHHFIVCARDDEQLGATVYRQLDPYALTFGFIHADESGMIQDTTSRAEAALVIDTTDAFKELELSLHAVLKRVRELVDQNKRLSGKRITTEDLIEDSIEVCAQVLFDTTLISIDDGPEGEDLKRIYKKNLKERTADALEAYRIAQATDSETAARVLDYRYGKLTCSQDEFNALMRSATDRIGERERGDKRLGEQMRDMCNYAPLLVYMQVYADILKYVWRIKEWGVANTAMEVAHPEFMIGAMYLNHYATHRKDGRINVARYLVRYSSSQLLWQVAQLDGESTEDPSMEAVGELVAQLPARQQHPRVTLTVQSQTA